LKVSIEKEFARTRTRRRAWNECVVCQDPSSRTAARQGDYTLVPTGYRARIRNGSERSERVAMERAKKSSGCK